MPHKRNPVVAERICGLARVVRSAALVGLENVALWHERDITHSSAERVVVPDAFLALDYMLDRFAWLVDGLVVYPERMRRNLEASHFLFFSQRVLLALVEAGSARDEAYRLVQRNAMRAWEEEQDFRELVARRPGDRATARARRGLLARAVHPSRRHRLRAPRTLVRTKRRSPPMPEAVAHVGSGKVRELYALDDERLLLVASDRISTFDVILPTEIPDKGRVLTGLAAFWFARTRHLVPNHLLALREDGRSTECRRLEMLPIECVVRGYLAGSGWKDYLSTGATSAATRCRRGCASPTSSPSRSSRRRRRRRSGHDENIDAEQAAELVGEERFAEVERVASTLYRFAAEYAARARDHHRRHEVRVRARRRRSARARRRGADAGLVAVLAGRRVRAGRSAALVRQAVRPRLLRDARLGQDRPGPGAAGRRRRGHARAATSRPSSASRGSGFDEYVADPDVVLR